MPSSNKKNGLFKCRSCESKSLELLVTRNNFPLYIWPLPENEATRNENIDLYVCDNCGYMQLQDMDEQTISEIYRNEAFNIENLEQNQERFDLMAVKDISKFQGKKVLEIGGGRNSFLGVLPENSKKWVADFSIDEKVSSYIDGSFIGNFIDMDIKVKDFDYIFLFHVLEHFNEPGQALQKIRALLKNSGKLVVEVPNFALESNLRPYYTIFHMHISLFTRVSLEAMLMRYGFNCDKFYKVDEVLLAEFSIQNKVIAPNHKTHSLKYINKVTSKIRKSSKELEKIFNKIGDDKVAIFGAGGASTLFIYNFPFLIERLACAIDSNKKKWGRFICNGKIPVLSIDEAEKREVKYVIVLHEDHIDYMPYDKMNYINIGNFYE